MGYIISGIIFLVYIVAYCKCPKLINKHVNFIIICLTAAALIYAQKAIDVNRKMKDEDKQIAIYSLVQELEQNKAWVQQFILDCEEGSHLGKNGIYSWPWNPPKLNANEKYRIIACSGDKELSTIIMNLYSRLESCGVIVNHIHELLNNSSKVNNSEIAAKVIENNKNIENFCSKIKDSFDEPVKELKRIEPIVQYRDSNKTVVDKNTVSITSSGTGSSPMEDKREILK